MDQIDQFIRRFSADGKALEVMAGSCSYWFAVILFIRFMQSGAQIVYDQREGRFGTLIEGRVYDATGDVTDGRDWVLWRAMRFVDERETERIVRECINFTDCMEQEYEE